MEINSFNEMKLVGNAAETAGASMLDNTLLSVGLASSQLNSLSQLNPGVPCQVPAQAGQRELG